MDYQITFERQADYVHAKIVGNNSQDTVMQYMQDVVKKCTEEDCFRVLIEENLDGPRLDAMTIFEMVAIEGKSLLGFFEAITFVDDEMGDMRGFAEAVAVNRGVPLAMFGSVDDARDWLAKCKTDSNKQSVFRDCNHGA